MNDTWNIDFISKEDFYQHVANTVDSYRLGMTSFDVTIFNSNTIDPIKLLLDKSIYKKEWQEVIEDEIFRQRDKSNNNYIGYFHQNLFRYINNCEVPQAGWDVIYRNPEGIDIGEGINVDSIYVEMKNKHNTMNSASSQKTYAKAQKQLLEDDASACFLVEAIAKRSQNIPWAVSVDGQSKSHKLIRRVSMDQFLALITGDSLAFYKICMVLPSAIDAAVNALGKEVLPHDSVYDELVDIGNESGKGFIDALYLLGFSSYTGFSQVDYEEVDL